MNMDYFLPGVDQQLKVLFDHFDPEDKTILLIGVNTGMIAKMFTKFGAFSVIIMVDDYEALLSTRLSVKKETAISVRMMNFENTDFNDSSFDLVYAQASISNKSRNKIIKEIIRILKTGGYFCVGENISLNNNPPIFVKEIWNSSNISPLFIKDIGKYYSEWKFEIVFRKDLSYTLKKFYKMSRSLLQEKSESLTGEEKNYYKKLIKKISHESNTYLKLGGDKYIGFFMLILRTTA